jgi:hypothetical protein
MDRGQAAALDRHIEGINHPFAPWNQPDDAEDCPQCHAPNWVEMPDAEMDAWVCPEAAPFCSIACRDADRTAQEAEDEAIYQADCQDAAAYAEYERCEAARHEPDLYGPDEPF